MRTPIIDSKVRPGETKVEYRNRIYKEMREADQKIRGLLSRGEIKVVMDVDDFGFLLPGYDDLLRLRKSFDNFRITAFTIPLPKEFFNKANVKQFTTEKYKKWAEIVNQQDWIEVAFHGFAHTHHEMEISYDKATEMLQATENFFDKVGLKYSKIFKAPFWQYSYDALVALRDRGYVIAIDRNHIRPTPEGAETYVYNWSFEEPLPDDVDTIKGHGHFTGRNTNNIADTLGNILHHLPRDTKFMTIGEHMAELKEQQASQ